VVTVESASYEVLVDMGDIAHGWASEATAQTETGSPTVQRVVIPVHELSAMPKASQRLLDDAAFDVESWLAGRIAEKFARAEATAFVNGDGVNKPQGFLTHAKAPNGTADNGKIGTIPSGGDGDFAANNPANALIDLVYALGAEYRANATFVMNSKTAAAVRKMRDADGRFLWADSLAMGQPAQLLGYPVLVCEDMPDIAKGSLSIAFGDFGSAYTIVERPDLRVLRDPFSAKPHVLFYATKRVGGGVTDARAVKLMIFG
ncbi:phage major capsid protein, partial [Paracoccus sp. (in: a-proteobacteria)]|uniref:phage major capsid protein n=1 Tax=Paracoccus sp. TaxID=267 RepID=UPI0028AD757F